jgi:hypothetical protein
MLMMHRLITWLCRTLVGLLFSIRRFDLKESLVFTRVPEGAISNDAGRVKSLF